MMPSNQPVADVCLILEGTYPYVKGGVSEWAHQLIIGSPGLTFHLWCIVPNREAIKLVYDPPPNVVGTTNLVLFDDPLSGKPFEPAKDLYDSLLLFHRAPVETSGRTGTLWQNLLRKIESTSDLTSLEPLLLSSEAYHMLMELYHERSPGLSFIDYYYTYLFSHVPLFRILVQKPPTARLYHAVATGYAGFAGCKARRVTGKPLLLTEHGIYTNERHIEIILADWIFAPETERIRIRSTDESLKKIWMDLFRFLGKLTYDLADRITTLNQGNVEMELEFGADRKKIEVIPNGVDVDLYQSMGRRTNPDAPLVALVGRVVAIKDVRTFIRSCRIVADRFPRARFVVFGSIDHHDGYYQKCLEYRRLLDLEERLTFAGNVKMIDRYPEVDVLVLSSVSEGLPLVLLEAMACSIPIVATRVGGCAELILGRGKEDQKLGASGILADVGDHPAIGQAVVLILENPERARTMGQAGLARVRQHYDLAKVHARYEMLYRQWLSRGSES